MKFDFETGYMQKKNLENISAKLRGMRVESGCKYYFNDSIKTTYSKREIESIVKSSDRQIIHDVPEVPIYWYINKGLQVRYSDDKDDANVEWLYFYARTPMIKL